MPDLGFFGKGARTIGRDRTRHHTASLDYGPDGKISNIQPKRWSIRNTGAAVLGVSVLAGATANGDVGALTDGAGKGADILAGGTALVIGVPARFLGTLAGNLWELSPFELNRKDSVVPPITGTTVTGAPQTAAPNTPSVPAGTPQSFLGTNVWGSFEVTCANAQLAEVAGTSAANALLVSLPEQNGPTWGARLAMAASGLVVDTGRVNEGGLAIYSGVPLPKDTALPACTAKPL